MDPIKFLEFAEALCSTSVCDRETDTRVGIDRCYYAVAHITYKAILDFVRREDTEPAVRDVQLLAPKIHAVLRRTLKKINASMNNRLLFLFEKRRDATYFLTRSVISIQDAIDAAHDVLNNQTTLQRELLHAYDNAIIDGTYWLELRNTLSPRDDD